MQVPAEAPILVAAFYKFVALSDLSVRQTVLQELCSAHDILGTILLAREGINATVSGPSAGIQALLDFFAATPEFADIRPKFSFAAAQAFHRMKVRLKGEIVTMGQADIDPLTDAGAYVSPQDWNTLIADADTLVIDTRNAYEVAIGTFANAVDPKTGSFREFPDWADAYLANLKGDEKPKNIAMFCTGGIRCEKATAYLVGKGYANVFHLAGGILKYLEEIPEAESAWRGDCFVFDSRVSVGHGLAEGDYDMCHACRMPLTEADKRGADYEHGVSCRHCVGRHSEADRRRFRERQKQIKLARARGEVHIGQKQENDV